MRVGDDWRPTASAAALARRAALLARVRAFFAERGVLEVDTPLLIGATVTDVHIHSARVELAPGPLGASGASGASGVSGVSGASGVSGVSGASGALGEPAAPSAWPLHLGTSPEYAMKRLLAAGSGDIYQIAHVVRAGERSRLHNPEFTLIEWYRLGFTLDALMSEVDALARELLGAPAASRSSERITYREAFVRGLGIDPLTAELVELERAADRHGFVSAERDVLLDFLMGAVVGPGLGRGALTFVHRYPASQAALAELDADEPRVALRFELYCDGIELANGFRELASSAEQRARFERDQRERARRGLPVPALDERLLAALEAGLPACSGVALGFDRLLMIALGAQHIDEVLAFPIERA